MSNDVETEAETMSLALRRAFSAFPTGVVAVCGLADGKPVGMAVNSFTSISLEPPLVAISIARVSTTWPTIASLPRLGLSVLAVEHAALCRQLSSRTGDRFAGADWTSRDGGAVHIDRAALWLDCSIASTTDGGDHEIVLLEVHDAQVFPDRSPLVFHQSTFRALSE